MINACVLTKYLVRQEKDAIFVVIGFSRVAIWVLWLINEGVFSTHSVPLYKIYFFEMFFPNYHIYGKFVKTLN